MLKQCAPLEKIELESCLRCPVQYELSLANPLDTDATFTVNSESLDLTADASITVPAHSEVIFK